jgi:hypothetical protein
MSHNPPVACPSCGQALPTVDRPAPVTCPHCRQLVWGGAPLPPPLPSRRLIGIVGTILVVVVGAALAVAAGGRGSATAGPPSIDQRMCQMGRAIRADYGVADTFEQSQRRVKALYEEYGGHVSGEIAAAARAWSEDISSGGLDLAFHGMAGFEGACAAKGL